MVITAVGFDLDATLVVPTRDRSTLLAEALDAVDAPAIDRDTYLSAHGRHLAASSREPIFADLLDEYDAAVPPEDLTRVYRNRVNEAIEPLPGVDQLLITLRKQYRVGLLTNGPVKAQRSKLETLGWVDAFDATVISGELEVGKPASAAFDELLDRLETNAAETVYVGDQVEADIHGATTAGLLAIQVCYPNGPKPDSRAVAHVSRNELVQRLPELLETLNS